MSKPIEERGIILGMILTGAFWLFLLAAAAPIFCWRIGESLWGCIISPVVVLIVGFPIVAIVVNFRPKDWRGLFVNAHTLCLVLAGFVLFSHRDQLANGASRCVEVIDSGSLRLSDGSIRKLDAYVPSPNFEAKVVDLLKERALGKRIGQAAVRKMSREIVSSGLATAAASFLKDAENAAKSDGYGIWGRGSLEEDQVEYRRLKKKFE
jgi:hypothetical protein